MRRKVPLVLKPGSTFDLAVDEHGELGAVVRVVVVGEPRVEDIVRGGEPEDLRLLLSRPGPCRVVHVEGEAAEPLVLFARRLMAFISPSNLTYRIYKTLRTS